MISRLAFLLVAGLTLDSSCVQAQPVEQPPMNRQAHRADTALPTLINQWWQWAFSMPDIISPLNDPTGALCKVGQMQPGERGDVFFLAGGQGGIKTIRSCTLSDRQAIFFPVLNVFSTHIPNDPHPFTCDQAMRRVKLNNASARLVHAELDGNPLTSIVPVVSDTCFDLLANASFPEPRPVAYPTAAAGEWVMLTPLAKGQHTLKFGGHYVNDNNEVFSEDVVYHLTVE